MSELSEKSIAYLSEVCGLPLSRLTLVKESPNSITFEVPSQDFVTSFRHMEQEFGKSRTHPFNSEQVDSVWTFAPEQHIVYIMELGDTLPRFFVRLLNVPYSRSALDLNIERLNLAYDALTQTANWQNLGKSEGNIFQQALDIEKAARQVGLLD